MRLYLSIFLVAVPLIGFADDPVLNVSEIEDQFTRATQDASIIEKNCAQARTNAKSCYQRVAVYTAQCRQQIKQQNAARGIDSAFIDREQTIVELNDCVQLTAQETISR